MRFKAPPEVFEAKDSEVLDEISRLFDRVKLKVHTLEVLDGKRLEQTQWFRDLPPRDKELLRSLALTTSYPSSGRVWRIGTEISLSSAVRLAYKPLLVLVENKPFDGLLVDVAVRVHASDEAKRLWGLDPPTGAAASIAHGGGTGDLMKELKRLVDEAHAQQLPLRLVVMIDSDSKWPGDISDKANEIQDLCREASADCLVLSCRCAENYIPDEAFLRWIASPDRTSMRPRVEALLRLTPDQRDHFPMKGKKAASKGMTAIHAKDAPAKQKTLFAEVPDTDHEALAGFDDKVILILRDHLPSPSADSLDSRDRRGDLRKLVNFIEKAL